VAICAEDAQRDQHQLAVDYTEGTRSLLSFKEDWHEFNRQKKRIGKLPRSIDLGIIRINSAQLVEELLPLPARCISQIEVILPELAAERYHAFIAEVHSGSTALTARIGQVEDFVGKLTALEELKERQLQFNKQLLEITHLYEVIEEFNIFVPEMELAAYATLNSDFNSLKEHMEAVETTRDEHVSLFSKQLEEEVDKINKEATNIRNQAQAELVLDQSQKNEDVIKYMSNLKEELMEQQMGSKRISKFQKLFKVMDSSYQELEDCMMDVDLKLNLWTSKREWGELTQDWGAMKFEDVDVSAMEETVQKFYKNVCKAERGLPPNKVVPIQKEKVEAFRGTIPVIASLRNKNLKERHWEKIEEIIQLPVVRDDTFTLNKLMEMQVMNFAEEIAVVSTEATQEGVLEEMLTKVNNKWSDIEFSVLPYKETKDTFILGGVEDVMTALEDSMVTMSTILSSRYGGLIATGS
jgi:dynein heavy chain